MAHLFGPSAQRDAQRAVPTDRRPSSPQVPWQAGRRISLLAADQTHTLLSSRLAAPAHKKEKDSMSIQLDQELRRFKDGDALRRQIPPSPSLRGASLLSQHVGPEVSETGEDEFQEQTLLFTLEKQPRPCRQARIREAR